MMNLKHQRKFIITVSVAGVVFLVWLIAFQLPLSSDYREASTKLEQLKVSNAEIRSLQSRWVPWLNTGTSP